MKRVVVVKSGKMIFDDVVSVIVDIIVQPPMSLHMAIMF